MMKHFRLVSSENGVCTCDSNSTCVKLKLKDLISTGASEVSKVLRIMGRFVPDRGFQMNV